jgi:hypothetical protein
LGVGQVAQQWRAKLALGCGLLGFEDAARITAERRADLLGNAFAVKGFRMNEDPRCCGSGTCTIDTVGRCWCGRLWDGEGMCGPVSGSSSESTDPQPETRDPE